MSKNLSINALKTLSRMLGIAFYLSACESNQLTNLSSQMQSAIALRGKIQYPKSWLSNLKTQADTSQIPILATVALLNTAEHETQPGALVASGLSNQTGNFELILTSNTLPVGTTYILEVTRRLGSFGLQSLSLRTYVRWTGTGWASISSPALIVNSQTTAMALVADLDPIVNPSDVLSTVITSVDASQIPTALGTHTQESLATLSAQVSSLIEADHDPVASIELTNGDFHVKKPTNPQLNWLNTQNTCPDCELIQENLSGIDLSGKNLSTHEFNEASLNSANLTAANLTAANLIKANLRSANLTQADLTQANLTDANLFQSLLNNTNLTQANLSGANLTGVNLSSSTLDNGIFNNAKLNSATLDGKDLRSLDLTGASFHWSSLIGANLSGMDLSGVGFKDANLSNANLSNTVLNSGSFETANLSNASLSGATLNQTNFTGAKLDGATWINNKTCEAGSRTICRYEDIVNSINIGNQQFPSVASAPDGKSIVVWNQGTAVNRIRAQRYDANGLPIGSNFVVSQTLASTSSEPDVAMADDGRFVVTWDHSNDGNSWGAIARLYNSDGTAVGSEFIVNQYTTGNQWLPAAAMDSDGDFVISWVDAGGRDGSGQGLYMRRFNSSGIGQNDTLVNVSQTSGDQNQQEIDMNNDYCAITFVDTNAADGSGHGVYARIFSTDGSYFNNVLPVNSYTNNNQNVPTIAIRPNNNLFITWTSNGQDGNGLGVYARRFFFQPGNVNGTGYQPDDEFRVNSYTNSNQNNSSIAVDSNGNYLIAWHSALQDGTTTGAYAQRYNHYGEAIGSEFQLDTFTTGTQQFVVVGLSDTRRATAVWTSAGADGAGTSLGISKKQFEF